MEMKDIPNALSKLGDDILTGADSLAKGAFDGPKKVAEYIKLKSNISQAESRLNATYIELGKKFEELYGHRAAPEFADLLAQIADARAQIAISRAELIALDSAAICSHCGKYLQAGQRFCPNCGAKQFSDPVGFSDPTSKN